MSCSPSSSSGTSCGWTGPRGLGRLLGVGAAGDGSMPGDDDGLGPRHGEVGVGRHLPAAEVDGVEAGLHLLHGLVAGQRAQRVDEGLGIAQRPQLLCAALGQRVLDLDAAALERLGACRLAYVTPSHQYPSGVTLSLARRLELLEWAEREGVLESVVAFMQSLPEEDWLHMGED